MIYDIVEFEPENTIIEHFGEGPFVNGYFTLINHTNNPLVIQQSDYSMRYCYCYEEEKKYSLYLHFDMNQDQLIVDTMDSIRFECGTRLMIDVDLHKSQKYSNHKTRIVDHSEILKSILPSLYLEIIQDSIHVTSSTYTWIFENDNFENSRKALKIFPNK